MAVACIARAYYTYLTLHVQEQPISLDELAYLDTYDINEAKHVSNKLGGKLDSEANVLLDNVRPGANFLRKMSRTLNSKQSTIMPSKAHHEEKSLQGIRDMKKMPSRVKTENSENNS